MASNVYDVFRLDSKLARYFPGLLAPLVARPLEGLLSLRRLHRTYARLGTGGSPAEFAARALAALGVRFRVRGALESVPASGPAIVIANHPYGGIEGLYLYSLLAARRDDVRVLGHHLLGQLPEFAPAVFGVDALGGRAAAARNAGALRRALHWLQDDGLLLVFPSPEVSVFDPVTRTALDRPWHPSIARLVDLARAPVVPVFVDGSNSALFHAAGFVHPRARTVLLPRELFNKRRHTVTVTVGPRLPATALAAIDGDGALTEHLRLQLYALACWRGSAPRPSALPLAPLAPAEVEALATEVAGLPPSAWLAASGDFAVLLLKGEDAPRLHAEIARLREPPRALAEEPRSGTTSVDACAREALQLLVWNARTREVVAGARLASVPQVLSRHGRRGLATAGAFELSRPMRAALGRALELGEVYVRPEYQRHLAPLPLLWKGVAAYVGGHPKHRALLATVRMGEDYSPAAQAIVTGYLFGRHGARRRGRLVRPRGRAPGTSAALRLLRREAATIGAFEALETLLGSIEADGKGAPALLRPCLQLGATVLGFNVSREAHGATDVLLFVDLDALEAPALERFLGRAGADRFRAAAGARGARRAHLRATRFKLIATP